MDADVQKAADDQARHRARQDERRGNHRSRTGSVGNGFKRRRRIETDNPGLQPVRQARRIDRLAAKVAGLPQLGPRGGVGPVAFPERGHSGAEAIELLHGVELLQPAAGFIAEPVVFGGPRELLPEEP